jgi:hypothetical protein
MYCSVGDSRTRHSSCRNYIYESVKGSKGWIPPFEPLNFSPRVHIVHLFKALSFAQCTKNYTPLNHNKTTMVAHDGLSIIVYYNATRHRSVYTRCLHARGV